MKITFLSYTYPYPKRGFNPGIERVIESLSKELARKGRNNLFLDIVRRH